jgi:hypothetical protein
MKRSKRMGKKMFEKKLKSFKLFLHKKYRGRRGSNDEQKIKINRTNRTHLFPQNEKKTTA